MNWFALALLLCGCPRNDEIVFKSAEGSGAGLGSCLCSYDNGAHGNPSLQITCSSGNASFASVSFFFDPPYDGTKKQGVTMILQAPGRAESFPGGGLGTATAPEDKELIGPRYIRKVAKIDIDWPQQTVCDVVTGCAVKHELPKGELKLGSGGCDDFWANVEG